MPSGHLTWPSASSPNLARITNHSNPKHKCMVVATCTLFGAGCHSHYHSGRGEEGVYVNGIINLAWPNGRAADC